MMVPDATTNTDGEDVTLMPLLMSPRTSCPTGLSSNPLADRHPSVLVVAPNTSMGIEGKDHRERWPDSGSGRLSGDKPTG